MKTFKIIAAILIIGFFGFIINSCGSKPTIYKQNLAFAKHISGYTSGMVSRKSTIQIELVNFVGDTSLIAENTIPDSTLLEDIFSFEPEIKGHAIWIDSRTIEFIPDEPLPANQFYNAEFDLEKVATVESDLETFPFQFSSYQQKITIDNISVNNYDDYNIEWQFVSGLIKTTDFADTNDIKEVLKATQNGKDLSVKIAPNYNPNEFYFRIDSIERKTTVEKILLTWNGENINSMSRGKKEVKISALGDFTVQSAKVYDNQDQSIQIEFSEPINMNQNLKGIITLEGVEDLTFRVDYNTVTVFLANRTIGDKKLVISNGIKNFKGYNILTEYVTSLSFLEPKPAIRINGNGSILPNSSGLIFPFEAVSLKSVDVRIIKIFENNIHHFLQVNNLNGDDGLTRYGKVIATKKILLNYDKTMNLKQWNSHVIDLGKLIQPDPGAIYRVSIKFEKEDALCDCEASTPEDDEDYEEEEEYEEEDPNWSERLWDSYGFDDGYDSWGDYSDSESPCNEDYYRGKAESRNILASDIGMIYKLDESKMSHAFLSNMLTTEPISNAEIQYFDYTKQIIASGKTDAFGMLDIQLKEKPFLMVAKYGKQRGYLKLADGYANSLSKFDIDGEQIQKGVKGYIYGERGVWRPGDSLYLNFILENKDHLLPANHPVKFELIDPNGQTVQQMTKTKNVDGIYDFRTMVNSEAPTGNYTAIVSVGNRKYTKNIKIETVKPNRLKIYLDIDKSKMTDTFASMKVKWLHGAIAKNLNATVDVSLKMTKTVFENYANYEFDSPMRNFNTNEETIFDGQLNQVGEAKIKTKLNVGKDAPGMLKATYTTKVFEEGGDFSIDRCSKAYSPFSTYVGIQVPKNKNEDNTLITGKNYKMDIVALSEDGKLKKVSKLQVKVYRLEWRWWYQQDEEDLSGFMSRNGTITVQDTIISANEGKAIFPFKLNYPDYGRFLITVTDIEGNHQTGKIVTVDWPNLSRGTSSNNENANMLNISSDKEKYTTGQKIKVMIPTPTNGKALISVETRSKVIKKYWISTQKGETVHEFIATKDMSPNAYIHVTLIQPHSNTKNDLPIRMYGLIPVVVDDPATHIAPVITMNDQIRPESTASIQVNEQNGKGMTYTLAIVDEGLLDLTRFQTPQPWNTFYAKEALGVQTWDMYDDVIGAYAGKMDKLLSIGGDGDLNLGKGNKANRFKPMVKFVGTFHLEPGQSKTHKVEIPNYIGSVRVMVVARNEEAYGSTEKAVAVKKPLMVLATLPRVLGPTEEVFMPVNIFAMEKFVKDVTVKIEVNDLLKIEGKIVQTLHFNEIGDEVINFRLLVASRIGIAKVKVTATSGKESAVDEIEIDVRPSNPVMYETAELILEPGKEGKSPINFKGMYGTNKATVEFSTLPAFGFEKRLNYLIQYPHGCIEQTTSSVFPQLFLANLTDVDEKQKLKISENIKAGIKRIQLFQTANGGFSYWPGESSENEWGTNFAGHFIMEAEKRGYNIPATMKTKWVEYQKEQAKNWSSSNNYYTHYEGKQSYELTQAYRLYTLALCNQAELGAMNRLREESNISSVAKWRLAAAYELVGQKEVAERLIFKLPTTVKTYREISYSFGTESRDEAMIIETLSLLGKKQQATTLVKELAKKMGSNEWMSTNETAYGLLAMCEYAGLKGSENVMKYSYKLDNNANIDKSTTKNFSQVKYSDADIKNKGQVSVKNTGKTTLFVKVIVAGILLIGDKSNEAKGLKMTLNYSDMKGNKIKPGKLTQGLEFYVDVLISNPTNKIYKDMALTQIFPSGWEIHNNRMDEESSITSVAQYQDIRDDRVYSYYTLGPNESKTFRIKLNATYLGKFYLPSVYSEAMYDHSISAKIGGSWVYVVKE